MNMELTKSQRFISVLYETWLVDPSGCDCVYIGIHSLHSKIPLYKKGMKDGYIGSGPLFQKSSKHGKLSTLKPGWKFVETKEITHLTEYSLDKEPVYIIAYWNQYGLHPLVSELWKSQLGKNHLKYKTGICLNCHCSAFNPNLIALAHTEVARKKKSQTLKDFFSSMNERDLKSRVDRMHTALALEKRSKTRDANKSKIYSKVSESLKKRTLMWSCDCSTEFHGLKEWARLHNRTPMLYYSYWSRHNKPREFEYQGHKFTIQKVNDKC